MDELRLKNRKTICLIIAFAGILEMLDLFVEPIIRNASKLSSDFSPAAYGVAIGTALIGFIPTIILIVSALRNKPEQFNIYTVLCIISYAITIVFSVFGLIAAKAGVANGIFGEADARVQLVKNTTWSSILTSAIMLAFYIVCTSAMSKQRKGLTGYTKKFVYCEFILLALAVFISLVTKKYGDYTLLENVRSVIVSLLFKVIDIGLVLVVKYIDAVDKTLGYPIPLPTEEGKEE